MTRAARGLQDTRQRLLEAAGRVFARKAYRAATVGEICKRARANRAAVSYHFGGKRNIYMEAWRHEFQSSIRRHPIDGGIPQAAPPEERLRGRILSLMRRILDPESREFDIFQRELADPTGLLAEVKQQSLEPIRQGLGTIVRELLGERASDRDVRLCRVSIMAQCLGPLRLERHRKLDPASEAEGPLQGVEVDELAEHVTRFSLAGIRELRAHLRAKPTARSRRSR